MRHERPFRIALGAQLVALVLIRGYYRWRGLESRGRVSWHEGRLGVAVRSVCGLAGLAGFLTYVFHPKRLRRASLPLPQWVRWTGVGLDAAALSLLLASDRALGGNFAATLHVTDRHTLVTRGPYRWIRHPMYTALWTALLGFSLGSANWCAGPPWLAETTVVMARRVGREEDLMSETFGERYDRYMCRTGRFLPPLRPSRKATQ